jgi:hypothetical protein
MTRQGSQVRELKRSTRALEFAAKAAKYLPGGTLGNLSDDAILH